MGQESKTGRAVAIVALGLALAIAGQLAAQSAERAVADPAARRTAMQRLSFMVGQWSGDAWAQVGRGIRHEVRQTESVRYAVGGQVLLVEGVGRALVDGVVGDTIFHALGTIDWRPDRGYVMRSYILNGQQGEFTLVPSDSGHTWGMDVPGGKVQYRMHLTPDGMFDERGWFVTSDGREVPTFAMLLRKVPAR